MAPGSRLSVMVRYVLPRCVLGRRGGCQRGDTWKFLSMGMNSEMVEASPLEA